MNVSRRVMVLLKRHSIDAMRSEYGANVPRGATVDDLLRKLDPHMLGRAYREDKLAAIHHGLQELFEEGHIYSKEETGDLGESVKRWFVLHAVRQELTHSVVDE